MGTADVDDSEFDAPGARTSTDELNLIAALRQGDEAAFIALVELYQTALVRVALMYVSSRAAAEDVVQETWLGVLQGLSRFEGRSSLKTWIFRILSNRAKTRAVREGRAIAFSALASSADDPAEPAVDPSRFYPPEHEYRGWWVSYPRSWEDVPESRLLARETRAQIMAAIETLPENQRTVISLRDVEGWTSEEVCNVLTISETNQRVLLHRARSKVRRALEYYLTEM